MILEVKHLLLLVVVLSGFAATGRAADAKTQNVILITTDGLRWQEVFQGAEEILLSKQWGSISDTNAARALWWRPTPEERRAVLFPFLWGTVAKQGQLFGNRTVGSDVRVTNGRNFSYPGYSEFLTGHPDPAIDSNDKKLNANTNVFEWLNAKPAFAGRVAAVVNWDVLPWILNAPRAGFPVWTGFEVPAGTQRLSVPGLLTEVVDHGRTVWNGVLLDTFVRSAAFHTVREMKPRALYVSYGETDDWAHEGNYERYLRSAHNFDRFLGELWALCQSMPEYRDRTSFVLSTDHGRGPAPVAWKSHGAEIPESAYMWMAVLGPDTPPLGERHQVPLVKQAQIASTVAALVGENFQTVSPNNAPPVTEALSAPRP
ncbi:MAG: hypothetical protein RIS76_2652 [Verrucomicrobiota bacterium]